EGAKAGIGQRVDHEIDGRENRAVLELLQDQAAPGGPASGRSPRRARGVPAGRCDGRKPTAEYGGVQHPMLLMWSVQHPSDLRRSVAGIGVGKSHESLRPLIE